jgi:ribosomal protein S18 acetylase RimI-like enzyme
VRRLSRFYKHIVFIVIILLSTSLFFWRSSCCRANINNAIWLSSFDDSRDRHFILDMFKKNWYWLVENPDFSPDFMMDHMSPDKKPEHFGKEYIKILFKDGEPLGFITYNKERFYKGYIHFLLVDEKHRGKRYAEKMMHYALNDLFSKGAQKVWLNTRESNKAARELYERLGFKYFYPYDIPGFVFFEITKDEYLKSLKK